MDNTSPKIVQLIAQDKNEKLQYEGRCKVIIDTLSKIMLIEPFIEEFKLISAIFTWKFVSQKNMLFVFSNIQSQDFALIFNDSHRCQKVYDTLSKKGATSGNKEFIYERFLPSLLNEISKNDDSILKMKLILKDWIERHSGKEREDLIQFLKDNNVFGLIYPSGVVRSRKRKLSPDVSAQMGENQSCNTKNSANFMHSTGNKNQIIEATNFEICDYFIKGKTKQKIIVYTSSAKTHCYEYKWNKTAYRCWCCFKKGKHVSAKIIQKNGKSTALLNSCQHICDGFKVIHKPMYEMVTLNSNTRIIVYKDSQLTQCYHYSWQIKEREHYHCISCRKQKCCYITAAICKSKDGTEFVIINPLSHVCKARDNKFMRRTSSKYLTGKQQIIEAPNFEMLKFSQNKKERKPWLIVFLDDSHTKCYEYSWSVLLKRYDCRGCQQKNKHRSTAQICQKDDGTNYVIIPENHICEIRIFNRDKFFDAEKQIVKAPNYETQKYFFRGKERSKILIFASSDKSMWYEYTWKITKNIFLCCGCSLKNQSVTAQICHFDDGTKYVKLGKSKHVCKPRKYCSKKLYRQIIEKPNFEVKEQKDAERRIFLSKSKHVYDPRGTKTFKSEFPEKIIESSNFKILKYKHNGKELSKLILFDPSNKQLCYDYFWKETQKVYVCSRCPFENRVIAILCKNSVGKEYLQLENSDHACDLQEFDPEKFKDDVIIKKPMYEFLEYTFKKTKKIALIIFTDPDKKFCYSMYKSGKKYYCTKCKKLKVRINATVQNQGKDDEFIYASNQKHICDPENYSTIMKSKKMKKL